MFVGVSCTDLQEEVLDEALGEDVLSSSDIADELLAAAYSRMYFEMNNGTDYFALSEVSSDEAILPYRGGTDWYDNGKYITLHKHTWTSSHDLVYDAWCCFAEGASKCLLTINKLSTLDEDTYSSEIAEATMLEAFYMSYMLDNFGVVLKKDPDDFGDSDVDSEPLYTDDAFDYIIELIDEATPNLKTTGDVGSGRMSSGAANALKARLYLNKAIYTDPYAETHTFSDADMDSVITYCDKVISSSDYALETDDYFNMFNADNYNNSELIYAFVQTLECNGCSRIMWMCTSRTVYASADYDNVSAKGGEAIAITEEFYDSWEGNHDDPRFYTEYLPQEETTISSDDYTLNRGILCGQQYGIVVNDDATDYEKDDDGNLVITTLTEQKTGDPLNYTYEVDLDENSEQVSGYRGFKYEYDPNTDSKNNGGVDIPLLRLGDVYLMKAEALLRQGHTSEAIAVVNELRDARGSDEITSLDLDQMLKERGYEMYYEQIRRTDQIRFDKWEDEWTSKTNSDIYRRLFPIPQTILDATDILDQNEGY